ncbi:hypothetical protein GUJ93_ZPchr0009g1768 [Zizania palustris]|uniref:Uncharacterized protein n=1 Tax=Zizania palustris TaxID=103762 RepID=A0A8J5R2P2_ZIZPA|nr:hypothetical protein GUJ93_ZPchr0009g1768 [Zizania palustris]
MQYFYSTQTRFCPPSSQAFKKFMTRSCDNNPSYLHGYYNTAKKWTASYRLFLAYLFTFLSAVSRAICLLFLFICRPAISGALANLLTLKGEGKKEAKKPNLERNAS